MSLLTAGLRRMAPRDPDEPHRAASTLELFFDLTFVIGVGVAAHQLLHAEEHGAVGGIAAFLVAFFAVWWPWVNFTWFASAFDTDDWLYRVLTIVQMGGVLVVAAGLPQLAEGDPRISVVGYVVMRLAMVVQWLRAARNPVYRATALRYAGGTAAVQVAWVLLLLVPPPATVVLIVALVLVEPAVPAFAERPRATPWHRHHIAERYGLFTLIVLGEGLLSVVNALIGAQGSARAGQLVLLGATALVLIAGMWWVYFARSSPITTGLRSAFAFGYLHYVVFASAAALAAGLELSIESTARPEEHGSAAIAAATTVPLALFLLATWLLVLRHGTGRTARVAAAVLAVAAGLAALTPAALQVAALVVVAVVVVLEVDARRRPARPGPADPVRPIRSG